jgi:hypothetical protein
MHAALIPPLFFDKQADNTTASVDCSGRLTIKKCQQFVVVKTLSGNSAMQQHG